MAWHDDFHPDKVYRYNDAKEWVRNAPDEETAAGRAADLFRDWHALVHAECAEAGLLDVAGAPDIIDAFADLIGRPRWTEQAHKRIEW